jgi:ribosome-associated heat shock protein Hsp15
LDTQRIDKWLWHARVVRTRTSAATLAERGCVRVNGTRIDAASKLVRVGDVLTIALDFVRILKVQGFSERRGGAPQAQLLYEDLTPPRAAAVVEDRVAVRPAGAGRPTKRERRALDKFNENNDL